MSSEGRGFILLTREPDSRGNGPFALLEDLGYSLRSVALTKTAPPADPQALARALDAPESYDWIAFTSARAVRALAAAYPEKAQALSRCRLGAVGAATGRAIEEVLGRPPDLIPEKNDAAHLAEALVRLYESTAGTDAQHVVPRMTPSRRVLFPAAEEARPDLPRILQQAGIEVVSPAVYSVVPDPPALESLLPPAERTEWSSIVLTSGAAARTLWETLFAGLGGTARDLLDRSRPAVLGPSARVEVERRGVRVWLEASRPSLERLAQEMHDRLLLEP